MDEQNGVQELLDAAEQPETGGKKRTLVSTFDEIFMVKGFINATVNANNKPLELKGGGLQTTIANVVVDLGKTGAKVPGVRIVKIVYPDKRTDILCRFPSSGGQFKVPMIDVRESDKAAEAWGTFLNKIVARFITWRKGQVKQGLTSVTHAAASNGVTVSDLEALKELGLV